MCKKNKMKSVLFCGLYVWSLIIVAGLTQRTAALNYQDDCELPPTTDLCDKKKHLMCKATGTPPKGHCDCGKEGEVDLFYVPEKSTCVSPAGGPCRDRFFNGAYVLECSRNAYCVQSKYNESGYCDCYEPYVPQESGHCIVSHGGPCNNAKDCDTYDHLTCLANTCVCGQKSIWEGSACKGLVGGTCKKEVQRPKDCVEHADCVSSLCSCTTGYQESTSDNRCYKQFNQTCDETVPRECHENFECSKVTEGGKVTFKCRCPANYDISGDLRKCLGRSGATCDKENPERSSCIDFATCTSTTEKSQDVCQCDEGYSGTNVKICRANYGTTCVMNATAPSQSQCNADLKLECAAEKSPVCRCKATHTYAETRGVCLGNKGVRCDKDEDCVSDYCKDKMCAVRGSSGKATGSFLSVAFVLLCVTFLQ